jgi:hypothetical protein
MGRVAALTLATALLVTLALTLLPVPAAQALPARFFGIAPQEALTDADTARMNRGGIDVVRVPVAWSVVQPTRDGGYEWDHFDSQVQLAAQNNLQVLPVLYHSPRWATGNETRLPIYTAAQRQAWKAFLREAVSRYGPDGVFWQPDPVQQAAEACATPCATVRSATGRVAPGTPIIPIREWQLWNEQNFFYFTKPASPKRYARLLRISSPAIRNISPSAKIILGGLFGRPKERPPKAMAAAAFLDKLYNIRSIKSYFDGVALHPYAATARQLQHISESIRRVMRRNGDGRTGFYITEVGWGSQANSDVSFEKGLAGQARELRRAYRYLTSNQRRLNLKAVYWFAWKDVAGSTCRYCDSVGLFRGGSGFSAKPAWHAFVRFTGGDPSPVP